MQNLFRNHTSSDYYYCMKNRSKTDIIRHILESVYGDATTGDGSNGCDGSNDCDDNNGLLRQK